MSASPAIFGPTGAKDEFERVTERDYLLNTKEPGGTPSSSPKTIYRICTPGASAPYYKIESNVRFRAGDVIEWLQHHGSYRVS